jgi:Uri superfamily endonuclease
VQVGRLGRFVFRPGWYLYVGSALGPGGLRARLTRHARAEKRLHWHIDYLLVQAELCQIWTAASADRQECDWARTLAALPGAWIPAPRFGASDCRCAAHLLAVADEPALEHLRLGDGARLVSLGSCL